MSQAQRVVEREYAKTDNISLEDKCIGGKIHLTKKSNNNNNDLNSFMKSIRICHIISEYKWTYLPGAQMENKDENEEKMSVIE